MNLQNNDDQIISQNNDIPEEKNLLLQSFAPEQTDYHIQLKIVGRKGIYALHHLAYACILCRTQDSILFADCFEGLFAGNFYKGRLWKIQCHDKIPSTENPLLFRAVTVLIDNADCDGDPQDFTSDEIATLLYFAEKIISLHKKDPAGSLITQEFCNLLEDLRVHVKNHHPRQSPKNSSNMMIPPQKNYLPALFAEIYFHSFKSFYVKLKNCERKIFDRPSDPTNNHNLLFERVFQALMSLSDEDVTETDWFESISVITKEYKDEAILKMMTNGLAQSLSPMNLSFFLQTEQPYYENIFKNLSLNNHPQIYTIFLKIINQALTPQPKDIATILIIVAQILLQAQNRYYSGHNSFFSDSMYDEWCLQYSILRQDPLLYIYLDSHLFNIPTLQNVDEKVGAPPATGNTLLHTTPMLSLDNMFFHEDIQEKLKEKIERNLIKKNPNFDTTLDYMATPKIDGFSLAIHYTQGVLDRCLTRGDGTLGENLTHVAPWIEGIPQFLAPPYPDKVEIRGEVFLPRCNFAYEQSLQHIERTLLWLQHTQQYLEKIRTKTCNSTEIKKEMKKNKDLWDKIQSFNARNFAVGLVRQLQPDPNQIRNLSFLAYDIILSDCPTYSRIFEQLMHWGVSTPIPTLLTHNMKELTDFYAYMQEHRGSLPFEADGLVYKVNACDIFNILGNTNHHPRGAIAHKFASDQATTRLEDIVIQTGKTGVITPVARLSPVVVNNATIRQANLHNEAIIKQRDIRIGDTVLIERSGDVIPSIIGVVLCDRPKNTQPFPPITHCPSCGTQVIRSSTGIELKCPAIESCPAQISGRLLHFASAVGIEGLGPKTIQTFIHEGILQKPSDLFRLQEHEEKIMSLKGFSNKFFKNILQQIPLSIPLHTFLYALCIPLIGEQTARSLAEKIPQSQDWLSLLKEQNFLPLQDVAGIGSSAIESLLAYSKRPMILKEWDLFLSGKLGVNIIQTEKSHDHHPLLYNKQIVLTGSLSIDRKTIELKLMQCGAIIKDSVSKNTDYLVLGTLKEESSKLQKAKKLGITLWSEEELLSQMNNETA